MKKFRDTTEENDYWWGHFVIAIGQGTARSFLGAMLASVRAEAYQRGLKDGRKARRSK